MREFDRKVGGTLSRFGRGGGNYRAATGLEGAARASPGRSRFSPKNSKIGEAMKIDEEVPMTIPKRIASAKPRITSPPISASGRIDKTTVSDVTTVRPRV